ncbi:MAG: hypothetical protein QOI89_2475 [Solirubrobacteraceae bacterium]|nr:hypothetical protein [Solirubrobacteraceae bacterium]
MPSPADVAADLETERAENDRWRREVLVDYGCMSALRRENEAARRAEMRRMGRIRLVRARRGSSRLSRARGTGARPSPPRRASSRSSASSSDPDLPDEPAPLRAARLALAPRLSAVMTFALLDAESRGAGVGE